MLLAAGAPLSGVVALAAVAVAAGAPALGVLAAGYAGVTLLPVAIVVFVLRGPLLYAVAWGCSATLALVALGALSFGLALVPAFALASLSLWVESRARPWEPRRARVVLALGGGFSAGMWCVLLVALAR